MRDRQPRPTQLADQFRVGGMQSSTEFLRSCGGKAVGQRGAELGNSACDGLVGVMDANPTRGQQHQRVDTRRARQVGSMNQHLCEVDDGEYQVGLAVTTGAKQPLSGWQ